MSSHKNITRIIKYFQKSEVELNMSVKLKREHMQLSQVICSRDHQTTTEYDIIVPDIKPDVLKVLRVNSEAVITQKNIQNDKVYLQGIIRIDILYIPDGNVIGNVKSISVVQDFSHSIDAVGSKPGMKLLAEVVCDIPEHTLVNSRKLSIRNKLNFSIKVTSVSEMDIATDVDADEPIRLSTKPIKISNVCCDAERDIIIRERLDVPAGKADLGEILRFSAIPIPGELRFVDNKAVVKGEIRLCTLYCGNDEDSPVQCMEHIVPFTEILEIDGLTENMSGEIDYSVKDLYCEISRDADGDKRVLGAEITLCACVRATETIECNAICDAYGLTHEIQMERSQCHLEQLIESASTQVSQKERVSVPDYLPELHQVCDCSAVPVIENILAENGSVCVSGYITCDLLYVTSDRETPISGFSHVLPFTHTFNIPGVTENSICEAKADTEHLSYIISGPRDIEIRAITALHIKAVNPGSCELISEINYDDDAILPKGASMVVYFVNADDTLWDIAKRFRTTPEEIIEINGPEKDCLKPGNRIYIFR